VKETCILYPVFVQAALTFGLLIWMGRERFAARARGEVKPVEPGVRTTYTGRAGQLSNSYSNQLEIPTLFYAVVAFALITHNADAVMVWLAWAYAGLRLVHAWIHTTYNIIEHRFLAFLASDIVLLTMWVWLGLRVSGLA
jgi:hypothetical protein